MFYIVISGSFIADYAGWALLIVEGNNGDLYLLIFVSFWSLGESGLIGNLTISSFLYLLCKAIKHVIIEFDWIQKLNFITILPLLNLQYSWNRWNKTLLICHSAIQKYQNKDYLKFKIIFCRFKAKYLWKCIYLNHRLSQVVLIFIWMKMAWRVPSLHQILHSCFKLNVWSGVRKRHENVNLLRKSIEMTITHMDY